MRRMLYALGIAVTLVTVGAAPAVAAGVSQRPAGPVVPVTPSENGGDNGWGNSGHNSSGGNPHTGPDSGGNGGYDKHSGCDGGSPTATGGGGVF
jgi:hypothetical protein